MTAKEKATELIGKFYDYTSGWSSIRTGNGKEVDAIYHGEEMKLGRAKQCALITVYELLNNVDVLSPFEIERLNFWNNVKEEIQNL